MKFLVIIEKGPKTYSAYVPDLPGCTSAGLTKDEALANVREAIKGHLELMREYRDPVPEPVSEAVVLDVEKDA